MRIAIAFSMLTVLTAGHPAAADQSLDAEMKNDVVLRAVVDELERGSEGLKIEDLERPYFIEYALFDSATVSVQAELGAVNQKNVSRDRRLRSDVRVGSYELDDTNFQGDFGGFFGGDFSFFGGESPMPIEDDYTAIRQSIWWTTDRKYKSATEQFEKKKAFMEEKIIEDKPNDFSKEEPVVALTPRKPLVLPADGLESLAVSLSAIFRKHADIKESNVQVQGNAWNKYLVNSEGTRVRAGDFNCTVTINATVQAEDGMELSDAVTATGRSFEDLPDIEKLTEKCDKMIARLVKVKNAPKLESYAGPVLFDAGPAAAIFSKNFARRFGGGQRALGGRTPPEDLAKKLGKRVLPRFIDVVDDPTLEQLEGKPVLGHYAYDDQGVPARKVTLVQDGKLKAMLMSRNPSKEFNRSNGHGRGSFRVRPKLGCLVMTAKEAADEAALKAELFEACEDEDLEFGIRVASLGSQGSSGGFSPFGFEMSMFGFGGRRGGIMPLETYKVYPDGREELVRGVEFAEIRAKAFKRILAAGDKRHVINEGGTDATTVAAPALLFEELDLAEIDRDFDKPPILPPPIARGATN